MLQTRLHVSITRLDYTCCKRDYTAPETAPKLGVFSAIIITKTLESNMCCKEIRLFEYTSLAPETAPILNSNLRQRFKRVLWIAMFVTLKKVDGRKRLPILRLVRSKTATKSITATQQQQQHLKPQHQQQPQQHQQQPQQQQQ